MKKKMVLTATVALVTMALSMTAYAAGWIENGIGWWYATNKEGTTWYANGWQWIDGNGDGIAECYCFDENGYLYTSTVTPDHYEVNADGAWIENGVVQTKNMASYHTASFTKESIHTSEGVDLKYLLYTPENAITDMPLILYLHGGSGKGDDLDSVTKDGFPQYLKDGELGNLNAYVVIPQLPANYRAWVDIKQSVRDLILQTCEKYGTDENRISITGHSMGGIGTYDIALAYPELFSCMVPMSGRIRNTAENIRKLSDMPVWAFVGSADTISDPSSAIEFIDSLSKVNKNAHISVLEGVTHSKVPEAGYKGTDAIEWMIGNSKEDD